MSPTGTNSPRSLFPTFQFSTAPASGRGRSAWTLVWLAVFCLGWGGSALAADKLSDEPTQQDRQIAGLLSDMVDYFHISDLKLDDKMSQRCHQQFLESLDPFKLYFLERDVSALKVFESKLDDQLRAGKLDFAFTTFRMFLERVEKKIPLIEELLAEEHDFTVDEALVIEPDLLTYAKDEQANRDRWRKRIKYDLLVESADGVSLEEAKEKLIKRYKRIAKRWGQTDNDELLEMFLTSLTNGYDPHSTYMSPHTLENFMIEMSLELDGIGAALRAIDGYTTVMKVIPGGAADRDGRLQADDKIVGVAQEGETEFQDVVEWKLSDVVPMIRGKRGTKVRLQVLTPSKERKVYEIVRDRVELTEEEAKGEVFEQGTGADGSPHRIGIIDLPSFYRDMGAAQNGAENFRSTTRDVRKILAEFKTKKVDAVVLDLRRNGGGSLTEAIDLTGLFIPRGPVVQVKDLLGRVRSHDDEDDGAVVWDGPLVVVVSKFSASASEILAGAIQDYRRGVVVGDPTTHGKGTVQTLVDIGEQVARGKKAPNLGALKVTIQKFYRPSGASTQNRGVASDIELPSLTTHIGMSEEELDYALAYDTVEPAPFDAVNLVNDKVLAQLRTRSQARLSASEDFAELQKDIARYLQLKKRTEITLNREKYLAQRKEFDAEEEEKKVAEDLAGSDEETQIQRDFYLDETMMIAVDLIGAGVKVTN